MSPEKKYSLRFGCWWWSSTKFYKLWKPMYAKVVLKKAQQAHPRYGEFS